jgi:glucans biosynthesis protein C
VTNSESTRRGVSVSRPGPVSASKARRRYPEFDALRGTAILLVVTLHASLAYTRFDIPRLLWGVRDPSDHLAFDLYAWWSMGVSVALFFAISGYFAAEVEGSRGPVAFLKSRARRVVLPMLAVVPVLLPLCFFAWSGGWLATGRATPHEFWRMRFLDPAIMTDLYGPAHLWFLEYLVPMLLGFGFWRKSQLELDARKARIHGELAIKEKKIQAARRSRKKKIRVDLAARRPNLSSPTWLLSPWAPLALTIPTVLLLLLSRVVSGVDAALDRHNSFFPSPIRLAYYATFFAFGVGLHRVRSGMDVLAGRGWWLLLAAIPTFAVRAWLLPLDWKSPLGVGGALMLEVSGALTTWLSLFGLLGVYRKHFGRPSRAIRTLAEASFWIYLAHLPIVGLIQMDLLHAPIPTLAKFAVTWTLTLGLGLSSYLVLVRGSRLGRFLNGGQARPSV